MRAVVERETYRLRVFDEKGVASFPVGVGLPASPTPPGRWAVKARYAVDPAGGGGPVLELTTPRMICLRGTEDLASLGRAASGG
ncbi:MAG: L,D-transpeptidase [Clostridia bacterium]|nr:L,D-transpeptidase [Clostridia bacterium]